MMSKCLIFIIWPPDSWMRLYPLYSEVVERSISFHGRSCHPDLFASLYVQVLTDKTSSNAFSIVQLTTAHTRWTINHFCFNFEIKIRFFIWRKVIKYYNYLRVNIFNFRKETKVVDQANHKSSSNLWNIHVVNFQMLVFL